MKLQCSGGPNDRGIDIQVQVYESRFFLGDLGDRFPLSFNAKTQRKQNHNMCLFSYFHLWDRSESLLEWLVVSTKIEEFPSMPFIREMVLLPWVSCVQHQESKTRSWGNIQSQYFSVGKLLSVPIRLFSPVWDQLRSCPFSQTTLFYGRFQT